MIRSRIQRGKGCRIYYVVAVYDTLASSTPYQSVLMILLVLAPPFSEKKVAMWFTQVAFAKRSTGALHVVSHISLTSICLHPGRLT